MSKILIVDDEPSVRTALGRALTLEGFDVTQATSGEVALDQLSDHSYDLMLLDVMMPGINGFETCKRLRSNGERLGVIIVTARDRTEDAVEALDSGADDYVAKPFRLDELLARIRAVLRRTRGSGGVESLQFDDLVLDPATLTAKRGDLLISLSRTEFALLYLFMRNPGKILSRQQIFQDVWGFDFGVGSNAHEVYVGYLRRKTETGGRSRLIHTVRGQGYVLRAAGTG